MTATPPLVTTSTTDGILTVTINRPEVRNALSVATHWELNRIFDDFQANPDLRVAILTGAGDQAFCAGTDLKEANKTSKGVSSSSYPPGGYGGLAERFNCLKPIIAAVNGLALGGGFELVLACDLVIASDIARFGLPEPRIGAAAIGGGMARLPMQIGLKPAMQILLTAKPITAERAFALGLINDVVAPEQLMQSALEMARDIAENAPLSVMATKQCVMQAHYDTPVGDAIRGLSNGAFPMLDTMRSSHDVSEGIRAFVEKRAPVWTGR